MTDEQRKRVHEITYSTQDREELAERIVRLEDERDLYSSLVEVMDHPDTANQLRAENAKLREQVTQLQDDWESERDYADQMEAKEKKAVGENAKLRELCGDLFDRLMDKDEHCGECRSQCEHDAWNFGDSKCVYAKRMCELGIREEQ